MNGPTMGAGQKDKVIGYLNIARALGIIAVVVGHSGSPAAPYLYLYHLALFYFISGYLFRDADTQTLAALVKKRLRSLYLPYVGYNLIFLALHNIFLRLDILSARFYRNYDLGDLLLEAGRMLLFRSNELLSTAMWFLASLFCVTIAFALVRRFSLRFWRSESITAVIVLLLFSFGIMTFRRDTYFFLMLNNTCVVMSVFYAGHLYRRHEDLIPMRGALAAAALVLLALLSRYGRIEMADNIYGPAWFFLACTFSGIYANIYCAKAIAHRAGSALLERIGTATIAILALHILSFKLVSLAQIALYSRPPYLLASFPILDGSGGWWVLYSLIGIFVPLAAWSAAIRVKQALFADISPVRLC